MLGVVVVSVGLVEARLAPVPAPEILDWIRVQLVAPIGDEMFTVEE